MADVVSHAAFAARMDAADLNRLKDSGLLVKEPGAFETLDDIPAPGYGEKIIGTLTAEEEELFVNAAKAMAEFDETSRRLQSAALIGAGEAVRDATEKDFKVENFLEEATAKAFFRLQRKSSALAELFRWTVCERLNCHDYVVGVRTGKRIVTGERKY